MNDERRRDVEHARALKFGGGVKRFAWFPVKLLEGDWLWLETYYAYYAVRNDGGRYRLWRNCWGDIVVRCRTKGLRQDIARWIFKGCCDAVRECVCFDYIGCLGVHDVDADGGWEFG